jgi:hypothetical protein
MMDFDNLPYYVLMQIMMYVSLQDRLENIRLVSKNWKYAAEESLRKQRKLTWIDSESVSLMTLKRRIKPTDLHSIITRHPHQYNTRALFGVWRVGMVKYWSHVFSLCPNLEELHMYDKYDKSVTELLNLIQSHGIKLKSFTYRKADLDDWPFPLENLETLAVREVSPNLIVKILQEATNLKHLQLGNSDNWPTFPSGLLSLKFKDYQADEQLPKLIKSPAFHTVESLENIYFDEDIDLPTDVFPVLRHISFKMYVDESDCLEPCNRLVAFLVRQIPRLESLVLYIHRYSGTVDILFSIPQFVDVLRRLKKLDIIFNGQATTINLLNVVRSCQNTELLSFNCYWRRW